MTRPSAVDPQGCACTECLTGEYVPLDGATPEQLVAMFRGEIADHTGIEWEVPGWLGRSDGGSRRAARGTWALAQGR